MQVMKWSALALAVATVAQPVWAEEDAVQTELLQSMLNRAGSAQAESKGFFEDSSLTTLTRAMYYNRDWRNGAANERSSAAAAGKKPKGYAEETGLSTRVIYESGFTQGTVGFGVNAYAGGAIKLDSGRGREGVGMFSEHSYEDGMDDDIGLANAAVKVRVSNTTLTHGGQMPALPVLAYDDGRLLPETFEGTMLTSNEIEGLEINAGRFTAFNTMNQSGHDSGGLKAIDLAGASYSFTDNFSGAFYWADTEDTYEKLYGNLNYNLPLAEEQALNFDFNIYQTDYDKKYTGTTDSQENTIWSLAAKYSIGAHAFILAHQRNTGDRGYDYGVGDGGSTIYLANSYLSDFNQEDERSWQASYELDMAAFGVPGLSFKTAYVWADNIKLADDTNDGKEHEFFNQVKYVVQEGAAKDLSFRVRSSVLRGNSGNSTADTNEVRAYVEYPLEIL
ncbi:OprD family outer membrane porin [Aquipseudomonas alcaligenes]|uniref:OprD family outer membrane porin n=1 Tax=Aquipseudomonas alcaligenes TaxID=43263 RepID=UPI0035B4E940